jgi:aspartyl-tRNA(Asn)/glutamyl-tRNA(Gln) amidotransferase subunit A
MSDLITRNKELNAFITILDKPRGGGDGPLSGLKYAAKDNFCTVGIQTTAASKILEGWLPPYESTVTEKLEAAGATLVGKTNLDEFAMGASTENSAYGVVKNPHDPTRVAGGSSGGSAAAVAAGLVDFATGTDTGGSIRQPSAFCGCIGLKPTYGRVSRYGIIPLGSSLDQAGVFARDVETVARVLQVIAGKDELDATSQDIPVPDYVSALSKGSDGLKVGVPREVFENIEIQPEIADAMKRAREILGGAEDLSLPHLPYSVPVYYIVLPAEASSNLARYEGVHFGPRAEAGNLKQLYIDTRSKLFGDEPKRRIAIGSFVLSAGYQEAYYQKAQAVRALITQDFEKAFESVDLILMPTTPTTAFKIGEKQSALEMYLADIYTVQANLAGVPAISVPVGKDKGGLPIGLQLLAPRWQEEKLLRAAKALHEAMGDRS